MKYFTIHELEKSATATSKGIDNTIPDDLKQNAINLVNNVLDKIREKYGKPLTINCCYRCSELNKLIGGSESSDHLYAKAADIQNTKELQELVIDMIKNGEIEYDQFIIEQPSPSGIGAWLHISYREGANRKQNLIYKAFKYISFPI